jgi:hypothetical protein
MVSSLLKITTPKTFTRSALDRSLFGTFTDFSSLDDHVRKQIYMDESVDDSNYEFVSGHVAYSTLKQHFPSGRFMTVLRRPASRLLSHFFYWRSLTEEGLRPWGSFAERIRLSHGDLSEFLSAREIACQTDNLLTRFLLWPHPDVPDDDFISPDRHAKLYRLAKRKLSEFDFVDLVENPMLERNVGRWLGQPFTLNRENVTTADVTAPRDLDRIEGQLRQRIDRLTAVDRLLFDRAAAEVNVPPAPRHYGDLLISYEQRLGGRQHG